MKDRSWLRGRTSAEGLYDGSVSLKNIYIWYIYSVRLLYCAPQRRHHVHTHGSIVRCLLIKACRAALDRQLVTP